MELKMFKKIIFLVFLSIISTLFLIELIGVSLFHKYPLFYFASEVKESTHNLYSMIDPNLGYTFDHNYKPTMEDKKILFTNWDNQVQRLENGFIEMRYKSEQSPIIIAILGGSATDSHLFNGNWPYFLHLLLVEKNQPHIIYNGAVSGYSTNQELIKLYRDVFSLNKIDAVISYSGVNDTFENEDITPDHPAVHPYQKYLADTLMGNANFFKPPTFLPNTFYMLKRFLSRNKDIQLGVKNNYYLKSFTNNIKYMNEISKINHAKFYHFLQPLLRNFNQIDYLFNNEPLDDENELLKIRDFLTEAQSLLANEPYFFSLVDWFSPSQRVFHDFCHLNQEGSKSVAKKIYDVLAKADLFQ